MTHRSGGAAAWLVLSVCAALLASACQPKRDSYYPLRPGAKWRYVMSGEVRTFGGWAFENDAIVRRTVGHNVDNLVVELSSQPARPLGGRDTTPIMTSSELHGGFWFSFWVHDARGVAEIARQKRGAAEPKLLEQPVYALRFPLQVGTTWDTEDPTEFGGNEVILRGTARIAAVDDTVTVPAGSFRRCVRIESESSGRSEVQHLYGRDLAGEASIETENTLWLAPGVGPVKYVSRETVTPQSLGSGEQTLELLAFSMP